VAGTNHKQAAAVRVLLIVGSPPVLCGKEKSRKELPVSGARKRFQQVQLTLYWDKEVKCPPRAFTSQQKEKKEGIS